MSEAGDDSAFSGATGLPQVLAGYVQRWQERLTAATGPGPKIALPKQASAKLVQLVASSEFAAAVLLREWEWFTTALAAGDFAVPLDAATLDTFRRQIGESDDELAHVKAKLRRFRNRCLIHILWRMAGARDGVWESLQSLSALADALIAAVMQYSDRSVASRFGEPLGQSGMRVPLVVLAMGKLGGEELNFSSDVDLIFLYSEDGETDGVRRLSAHEYFVRCSRQIVTMLDDATADGFVFRVDTRLRPFGDSGPVVISFAGLENYLLQHGRSWERYAYVKARAISPMASAEAINELYRNIIHPFVYRRYLDYGVFESLREMKSLIEAEVQRRELAQDVKLGPGGIREVEFIVQSLQLVRGGAHPDLRSRSLREALSRLDTTRGLGHEAVAELMAAYEFLRRFENAVQAIRDQQTHAVPESAPDRARLGLAMGRANWESLAGELQMHRDNVSRQFAQIAFRNEEGRREAVSAAEPAAVHWKKLSTEEEWLDYLQRENYVDADRIAACLGSFGASPLQRQLDATTRRRLDRFMQTFIDRLKTRDSPGVACERIITVVSQIVRRSAYLALLNENPAVLERLVALCEKSAYLTGEIERFPLLLDELLDPRLFTETISVARMRGELDERLSREDADDSEAVIEALARFQRASLFRIAVADVSGVLPIMQVSDRLTELAEIVLEVALDVAWRDLTSMHGQPSCESGTGRRKAGFGVIAYGKLGGIELSYRSDLDLVFLHNSQGEGQMTDGEKPLDNSVFFARLVRRLVHFLTTRTSSGALYEVDTRLRPSGRSGLLVISTEGFAKYQEQNAWTWEHQALLRSRPVAGSARVAREFEQIRSATLRLRVDRQKLLDEVLSMRQKMRKQLDRSSTDQFDLKQGEGGIGDIEFLVQYLVLKNAEREPALIFYPDNIRQLGTLEGVGCLDAGTVAGLQEAYKAFRLRMHRLTLDERPPIVDANDFADERDFVTAIWHREMH